MKASSLDIDAQSQPFTKEGFVKFRQLFKVMVAAVVVLSLLFLACAVLIIVLGVVSFENKDDIDKLNKGRPVYQGTGYWSVRSSLPFDRSDHAAVAVGDLVYILGGHDSSGNTTDDVTIFDTVLNTFTKGPKMPVPLSRFAHAYVPDKGASGAIYLMGGMEIADGDASPEVHILDIDSGKWSKGPEIITPRSDFCGAYVDGKIYIAGGWPTGFGETLGSVEELDVENGDAWEEGKELPTPRGDCKAVQLDGKFVVLGGYYDEKNEWRSDAFREEVEAFDPASGEWTTLAPMPNARGDKAVIALPGNRLMALGGETHSRGERTQVATHFVEEYLGEDDIWVQKAPMPLARFRTDAAFVDGVVFVFGGHAICSPTDEEFVFDCPETDEVQAFFDVDHSDVFLVSAE